MNPRDLSLSVSFLSFLFPSIPDVWSSFWINLHYPPKTNKNTSSASNFPFSLLLPHFSFCSLFTSPPKTNKNKANYLFPPVPTQRCSPPPPNPFPYCVTVFSSPLRSTRSQSPERIGDGGLWTLWWWTCLILCVVLVWGKGNLKFCDPDVFRFQFVKS